MGSGSDRPRIAFLPLAQPGRPGSRVLADARKALRGLAVDVLTAGPALAEGEVLEAVDSLLARKPDGLLILHTRGGSARSAVLAAVRSGLPTILWAVDTEYSLPSAALAAGTLRDLERPAHLVHGEPSDASVRRKLLAALRAAYAAGVLRRTRIGTLGAIHPNLTSVCADPWTILRRLGPWVTPVTIPSVEEALRGISKGRVSSHVRALSIRADLSGVSPEVLRKAAALDIALLDLARRERLDAIAIDCWNTLLPHFGVTPCLLFLHGGAGGKSKKVRGVGPLLACEGDAVLAASLVLARALAPRGAFAGDVFSLDEASGVLTTRHCGAAAALSARGRVAVREGAPPAVSGRTGAVISVRPVIPKGPGTLFLICGRGLDTMHIAQGHIAGTESQESLSLRVGLAGDGGAFCAHLNGNHYLVMPGDHREELAGLADLLGLRVVED
ncbi:MAG: hypothetical protein V2A58_01045 [Planctomycetota bacterium]